MKLLKYKKFIFITKMLILKLMKFVWDSRKIYRIQKKYVGHNLYVLFHFDHILRFLKLIKRFPEIFLYIQIDETSL